MDLSVKNSDNVPPAKAPDYGWRARMVSDDSDFAQRSPFLLTAEDWYAPPAAFPRHPHRGMETVSFVLSGQVIHEDHTGGHGVLNAGDVQFMTAGAGVLHSENPGPGGVHALQLWLNLPARLKRVPAHYVDMRRKDAPVYREHGVEAVVYAGGLQNVCASFGSTWPLTLVDLRLSEATGYDMPLPAGERVFVYVLEGQTRIGVSAQTVSAGQVAWMNPSSTDLASVSLRLASQTRVRALIFSSPTIDEPVIARGPYVMNTNAKLTRPSLTMARVASPNLILHQCSAE